MQDPKYQFVDNAVVNRRSGEVIPADEPVFVFRARDIHAVCALNEYAYMVPAGEHRQAVLGRVLEFAAFAVNHPARMKEPDTDAGSAALEQDA